MITEFFFTFFSGLAQWVASLLPDAQGQGFALTWDAFNGMNYFLPLSELVDVMMGFMVLGGPFAIVSITVWLLSGFGRGESKA